MFWLNEIYGSRYSGSILLLEYHHILIQHTQLHLPQSNVTSMCSLNFPATLCTDQYILVCTTDVQVHTHYDAVHTSFQSSTISFATLTSLRQSSVLWVQVAAEEELGPCSPTVFQGKIMAIFPMQ